MSEDLTFNQVNQQESSAYINGRKGRAAMPSVLIGRSDGRVTVGSLDMSTHDVYFTENGQNYKHPQVSLELLSDEHQEKLAAELAGVALRGSEAGVVDDPNHAKDSEQSIELEIAQLESDMDALKESMLESDRTPAWKYAIAVFDNEIVRAFAQLSNEGKSKAIRYRELFQRLEQLRDQQISM